MWSGVRSGSAAVDRKGVAVMERMASASTAGELSSANLSVPVVSQGVHRAVAVEPAGRVR